MSEWLPGTWAPKGRPVVNLLTNPSFETASGSVEVRRNRVKNPSFEGGSFAGWNALRSTITVDTTRGRHGSSSLKVTVADASAVQYVIQAPTSADRAPVSAGETVTVHASVYSDKAASFGFQLYEYDAAGNLITPVVSSTYDALTPGQWTDISRQITVKAIARSVRVVVIPRVAFAVGDVYWVDGIYLGAPGPYFDGSMQASPDPDLTPSWVGTPNASESVLTGVPVAGITTSGCVAIRSTRWSKQGPYSLRLIPNSFTTQAFAYVPVTLGVATGLATCHLEAPLTGTLASYSRAVRLTHPGGAVVDQAPNAAGTYELRVKDAAAPTGLWFGHGGFAGSGDAWFDCAGLFEGEYTGPWFSGDSPTTDELVHAWTGQRNASPSTRQEMEAVMATIYGTLTDFGLQTLTPYRPVLRFTPSGPGVKGRKLFSERPVEVKVASDGTFAVLLEPTDGVVPEAWYTVSIEYLNESGAFTSLDILGYRLYVPAPGGAIGDLPGAPLSADTVLVSLDPPPAGYKGWYLNAPGPGNPPGDPNNPASSGTGILEIVS